MYSQLPRPTIFAHRGSSAHAPENTLAAFELAIAQHADAVEFDVKITADGHIIVFHDETVDRMTDGSGQVSDLSLAALKELDAGSKFDQTFQGEKIPTLLEVFETIGGQIFMNIELKNYASPMDSLPKKVADSVQKLNLQDQVIISSFNPVALRLFHKYCPEVPLGLLALPGFGGFWARSFLGRWVPYQALHPGYQDVNATMLHKQHGKGRRINTYTVNHPDEMKRLFALGIDGIITDDPIRARQTLNEFNEERQSRQ